MKKFSILVILVLGLVIGASAQTKSNDIIKQQISAMGVSKNVQLEYDSGSNSSKLIGLGEYWDKAQCGKNGLSELSFGMAHDYAGKALPYNVPVFMMTFWAKGKGGAAFSNTSALTFVADGEAVEMGNARYAKKGSMEYLNFMMNREQLGKLANAKSVVVKLGGKEFAATEAHMKVFKGLFAVSDLENK